MACACSAPVRSRTSDGCVPAVILWLTSLPRRWWRAMTAWFADRPIALKVVIAPSVGLLALLTLAVAAWLTFDREQHKTALAFDELAKSYATTLELPTHLAQLQAELYKLSIWHQLRVQGPELARIRHSIEQRMTDVTVHLDRMTRTGASDLAGLREPLQHYLKIVRTAAVLIGRSPLLGSTATRGAEAPFLEAIAAAERLKDDTERRFVARSAEIDARFHDLGIRFSGAVVLLVILVLAVALLSARTIAQPIRNMAAAVDRLAAGDMRHAVIEQSRGDEIGQVARAIVAFKDSLARNRELEDQRRQVTAELQQLAYYDPLTGLGNRALFRQHFEQVLRGRGLSEATTALLLLDLDRFKEINDGFGHDAGDLLLVKVAERLREILRPGDSLCRLGGDEFAIVLAELAEPAAVIQVAERILHSIRTPFDLDGQRASIATSIGIALAPGDGTELADLVRHADLALYEAKDGGRNLFRFFEPRMNATIQRRQHLEAALRQALDGNLLELFFQPQIELASGQIAGAEALLRWWHEGEGWVSPAEFVPVAERSGLIHRLGAWVLGTACRQARLWRAQGLAVPPISINVSAEQFARDGFVEATMALFEEVGLPAGAIKLELTESVFVDSEATTVKAMMEQLRSVGLTLSLDDFGTGYSSLGYLRQLPIGELKIDACFVHDLGTVADAGELVGGIIALGHSLGMTIVGEGVETEQQAAALRALGCELGQGYVFERPMPQAAFASLLAATALDHRLDRVG